MAEAEAMKAALLACVENGFAMVQVETDSKIMVDMVNGVLQPEAIIKGIMWDFLFTPRACNGAAYLMPSYVTRVGSYHTWDCFEPKWLFN
ncbi:ribonuclease H protein [Pyrus ussuriensis x Pyrus communis]|uniref:Ribonuclease H protein n=1 Tax=Pyrus ussuriensis x Pyrus communis TaxID=2448454 RepID=A0A5N5FXH6_9ROSA|nr:ribonuclease H protein [Pyrus ussuriensis x Pyrus communis]